MPTNLTGVVGLTKVQVWLDLSALNSSCIALNHLRPFNAWVVVVGIVGAAKKAATYVFCLKISALD